MRVTRLTAKAINKGNREFWGEQGAQLDHVIRKRPELLKDALNYDASMIERGQFRFAPPLEWYVDHWLTDDEKRRVNAGRGKARSYQASRLVVRELHQAWRKTPSAYRNKDQFAKAAVDEIQRRGHRKVAKSTIVQWLTTMRLGRPKIKGRDERSSKLSVEVRNVLSRSHCLTTTHDTPQTAPTEASKRP